ncbi:hypothetical protein ALON55S_04710 [Alishewanella longhuensis]
MQRFAVAKLFDGENWHEQVEIVVEEGVISRIQPAKGDVLAGTLAPGFIDLQVNGGGGVLFNTAPELATLTRMMQAHSRFGSTAMLPTLITDDLRVMQQSADVIAAAISQRVPGILGVHFEGPHLSVPKRRRTFFVALLGLANALVWPAVWPLALAGLGKLTATGSAMLIMGIAGGAVLPLMYGYLAETSGNSQGAYWILLPCYLFILFYAFKGHKLTAWSSK